MRHAAVVIAAVIAFVARASAQCCCDKASRTNGLYSSALEPGDLALALNEDDFEDYLDEWLAAQQETLPGTRGKARIQSGCSIRVNGDLGQPQPVYLTDNNYTVPAGNSGAIHLDAGNRLYVACPGSGRSLTHPQITTSATSGYIACVNGTSVSGAGWLDGLSEFGQLACSSHPAHQAEATTGRCYNDNLIIRIGYVVDETFYPLYWSCFDQNRLEVLYVWYEQTPANSVFQSNVDRPSWLAGTFFPGVAVNSIYTQVHQKAAIAQFVGSELAEKYITNTQFLARGHLAAKTDFVFATAQRASFYFINAAPQWQPKNAGNWNWVEQNLRTRIGSAGYHTVIYTGTFGVTQLRDSDGRLVDIYLHVDANNNPQIPVPLYYYKVVYDESLRLGTAFVSINNPYYNATEVQSLQFCRDQCRNNSAFDWLHWQPDRIDIGYSFCCTVPDFRRVVSHLPDFEVVGLLT